MLDLSIENYDKNVPKVEVSFCKKCTKLKRNRFKIFFPTILISVIATASLKNVFS